jgi:MOSC domain-containing protein YiiM
MTLVGTLKSIAVRGASRAPMQEHTAVDVTIAAGIVQDYRGQGLRQVTFLDMAQWQRVMHELGADLPWHTRRANLLIDGFDLRLAVGYRLQIGDCRFAIGGETEPCQRMEELQAGLRQALGPEMRAGVWGKVLQGGRLEVGQNVSLL